MGCPLVINGVCKYRREGRRRLMREKSGRKEGAWSDGTEYGRRRWERAKGLRRK